MSTEMSVVPAGDTKAAALIEFLRAEGAGELRHGAGRTLLEHLVGTYDVVRRWGQPTWLQHAALLHSVYGTDIYGPQLLTRRDQLRDLAGPQAERLAYLFSMTPRGPLLAGSYTWMRSLPTGSSGANADEGDKHAAEARGARRTAAAAHGQPRRAGPEP